MVELQTEAENAEELRLGPVFDNINVQALSNSEALYVLGEVEKTRKAGEPNFVPTPMVQQTKQYLERFNSVKNKKATDSMRENMHDAGLKQFEICSVINLLPSTVEEVKALVPSIEAVPGEGGRTRFEDDEDLQALLDNIQTLKEA